MKSNYLFNIVYLRLINAKNLSIKTTNRNIDFGQLYKIWCVCETPRRFLHFCKTTRQLSECAIGLKVYVLGAAIFTNYFAFISSLWFRCLCEFVDAVTRKSAPAITTVSFDCLLCQLSNEIHHGEPYGRVDGPVALWAKPPRSAGKLCAAPS